MPEKNNIHKGHRQRMTDKYLKYGIEAFNEQEILEMLLYSCYTRVDTSQMAKALLEHFGSLKALAIAGYDEIVQAGIIGERAAATLCYIKDFAGAFLHNSSSGKSLCDVKALKGYCLGLMKYKKIETVHVLLLDNALTLVYEFELSRGDTHSVHYDLQTINSMAIKWQCSKIVIVHNHPDGPALASSADVAATRRSYSALRNVGLELIDHIIVSRDDALSMRQASLLVDIWS